MKKLEEEEENTIAREIEEEHKKEGDKISYLCNFNCLVINPNFLLHI